MTITSFIPLIGSFSFACRDLKIQDSEVIYSLSDFKKNEEEFLNYDYFANKQICYLDEASPKIKNNLNLTTDMSSVVETVKDLDIPSYDIMTCIPPCGGLSQLNSAKSRGTNSWTNRYLLMCVKLYLATDSEVLCVENAPNLSSKAGVDLVKLIRRIIEDNGYKRTIQMVKTNTMYHGLPQYRERTFMFIHKRDYPILLMDKPHNNLDIPEFLKQFVDIDDDPMNVEVANGQIDAWKDCLRNTDFDRVKAAAGSRRLITMWQYILKDKASYVPLELLSRLNNIISNKESGRNFWDESPYLPIRQTGAIIGKNGFKIIDPNCPTKFLTLRQLMRLMGFPEDFSLKSTKNPNVVCQSVPVNTAEDAILWAMEILNPVNEMYKLFGYDGILIQDNRKQHMMVDKINISYI